MPKLAKRLQRVLRPTPARKVSGNSTLEEHAYAARVTAVRQETTRAVTIEFELLDGYRLNYRAGQAVNVVWRLGAVWFVRTYSLSSAPTDDTYAFTVQRAYRGRLSTELVENCRVGDLFYIEDPAGEFTLPAATGPNQAYLMLAGGVGVVPVRAMIKTILGVNPLADIRLVQVVRDLKDAIYYREFERWTRRHAGFQYRLHVTRKDGQRVARLRPQVADLMRWFNDPGEAECYLSAPPALTRLGRSAFEQMNLADTRIHTVLFQQRQSALLDDYLKPRSLTFIPAGLGQFAPLRMRQSSVETVLETARANGIDLPVSCEQGDCGRCRIKVRSGSVLMDEPNSLSLDAARQGYILACSAYPVEALIARLPARS